MRSPGRRRFTTAPTLPRTARRARRVPARGATTVLGAVLALVGMSALAPEVARAQGTASLDLGVSALRQAGIPSATVTTFGGEGGWRSRRFSIAANAIAARAPDDRWTGQGLVGASVYAGPSSGRWELGTAVGAFGQSNDLPSTSVQLVVRRHTLVGGVADLFAGAGGAATEHAQQWVGAGLAQIGASAPLGGGVVTSALSYVDANRLVRAEVPPFPTYTEIDPVRFGDAIAFWQRTVRAFDLSIGGGGRVFDGTRQPTVWGSASVAWRATGALIVVAAVGRALEDVVRSVPEARYASLALRVPIGSRQPKADAAAPRLFVASADAADTTQRVITVRVASATTVELMADFTEWSVLPLARASAGDVWTLTCAIAPGAHRVAVRVDGGEWSVPANLPRIDDDYGGSVGLITVP